MLGEFLMVSIGAMLFVGNLMYFVYGRGTPYRMYIFCYRISAHITLAVALFPCNSRLFDLIML